MAKKLGQKKKLRSKSAINEKTKEELIEIRKLMMKRKGSIVKKPKKELKSKTAIKLKKQ